MPLVYTICMGMSGNGVKTLGIVTIMAHRRMGVRGFEMIMVTVCCAVVRGSTLLNTVVVPVALIVPLVYVSTSLVFVLLRGNTRAAPSWSLIEFPSAVPRARRASRVFE